MKKDRIKVNQPKKSYWIENEPKRPLSEVLDEADDLDQRGMLFVVLLVLGFCNSAVMVLAPAYVVYRRALDHYPFISRFELFGWLFPIVTLSAAVGIVVFIVCMILYAKFHNAISNRFDYWTED